MSRFGDRETTLSLGWSRVLPLLIGACCLVAVVDRPAVGADLAPLEPGAPRPWERGIDVGTYTNANLVSGNLQTVIPLASWSGLGPPMVFNLYHNSADGLWRTSYSRKLVEVVAGQEMMLIEDDGREITFTHNGSSWDVEAGYHLDLTYTTFWQIKTKSQWIWEFDSILRLSAIVDAAGNRLTVVWATPRRMTVTDAAARYFRVYLKTHPPPMSPPLLPPAPGTYVYDNAVDFTARTWTTSYTFDELDQLTDPMGFTIDVTYASEKKLSTIADKEGDKYTYEYHPDNRLDRVMSPVPFGDHQQHFVYTATPFIIVRTDYTDVRGTLYRYWFNSDNNYAVKFVVDMFKTLRYEYDADMNLTDFYDGVQNRWIYAYDVNGNKLSETDPVNPIRQWAYDAFNNVTSYTDAEMPANVTTFEYFAAPNDPTALKKVTLPPVGGKSGIVTLDYYWITNKLGLLLSVTDPNGVVTEYDYDGDGQLSSEKEGTPHSNPSWARVHVNHDFDALSRHLRTWIQCLSCSASSESPRQGPTEAVIGGSVYDVISREISNSCVVVPPGPEGAPSCPDVYGQIDVSNWADQVDDYDKMGRLKHSDTSINGTGDAEVSDVVMTMTYDALGRKTFEEWKSTEPTWHENVPNPPGDPYAIRRLVFTHDALTGKTVRAASDGLTVTTWTEAIGRVDRILGEDGVPQTIFEANYTYLANRDLIDTITYANGTSIEYDYDAADRITEIRNRVGVNDPFLKIEFLAYNGRNLPTSVRETRDTTISTITYTYDARSRLTRETRDFNPPYDLEYTYDQGGNRTSKIDTINDTITNYTYDVDDPDTFKQMANRLMYYEVRDGTTNALYERVEYEYDLDAAAGNISQILRKMVINEDPPAFNVYATCFTYNKAGEVWIVTNRFWSEFNGVPGPVFTRFIREFRGNGRRRYMVRDRCPDDMGIECAPQYAPLYDTAVWTAYDGDLPVGDYTIDVVDEATQYTYLTGYQLGTAEADLQASPFAPTYYHGDQIGSTRAMSDGVSAVAEVVYTAFGEIVHQDLSVGTRYRYAGQHGYECFDDLDWGEFGGADFEFPYLHLGHRWYDPATGRFLQRDPLGASARLNVYVYVGNTPLNGVDVDGLVAVEVGPAAAPLFRALTVLGGALRRIPQGLNAIANFLNEFRPPLVFSLREALRESCGPARAYSHVELAEFSYDFYGPNK